ncbi:enduracididine biosynthesis enzyme MppR [Streptomyces sp. PanSC19]|uniref:enduracididine biosynthesis enzyme MppR n=1 Tax=Streptomyces sp. PanSC19 TaxID=1520455 RepID=UPI000F45F6E0|nr:enduracididine biosynthesis enzyme MppR [Streptomyces sp. PanSC19]ROQ34846.1 enduracididine biosynthesis enzyme MppR [Streptomyces sp. PanSC19]
MTSSVLSRLRGYSLPLSPSGTSAMLTPPPWHFSGEVVMVDYRVDPVAAAAFLPPELDLGADPGRAAAVFAHWQWCSEPGTELADPGTSQFGEFLILLACEYRGRPLARCPYAWVDQPVPLLRGWVQGMPKQFGELHQTRPMRVGRAGPLGSAAGTYHGTASTGGRRFVQASVNVTAPAAEPPALHTVPLVHTRVQPSWVDGEEPPVELVTSTVTGVEFSEVWSGDARLEMFDVLDADFASLRPVSVGRGHVFGYAETLVSGRPLT